MLDSTALKEDLMARCHSEYSESIRWFDETLIKISCDLRRIEIPSERDLQVRPDNTDRADSRVQLSLLGESLVKLERAANKTVVHQDIALEGGVLSARSISEPGITWDDIQTVLSHCQMIIENLEYLAIGSVSALPDYHHQAFEQARILWREFRQSGFSGKSPSLSSEAGHPPERVYH